MTGPEQLIQAAISRGDHADALHRIVDAYGAELMSYCQHLLRDPALADDAAALFLEDMWRGLANYRGDASVRVYAYVIARHAAFRVSKSAWKRRHTPLDPAIADELPVLQRTTATFLRTESREAIRALRELLTAEEREILRLRVDAELSWAEVDAVLRDDADVVSDDAVQRRVAVLRKQFERIKEKLRVAAQERGLLDRSS